MFFEVSKDVSPRGDFTAVLSASSIDRQGERVLPSAFAAFKGMRRPLLVAHRDGLPIGTASVASIESDRVIAKGSLYLAESADARHAMRAMQEGNVGLSYRGLVAPGGASMKSGVREISRLATLDEITITAMPANSDARILSVKSQAAREIARAFAEHGRGMNDFGVTIPDTILMRSLIDGVAPPGVAREKTRMAHALDRDPSWPRFAELWSEQECPGGAAYGLTTDTGTRSTASTLEGAVPPDVTPTFTVASVGTMKFHIARANASVEILSDWSGLEGLIEQYLDSNTADQRDAAALVNALAFATNAGNAPTIREAAVAALAACGAAGWMPTSVSMNPGDYFRTFGADLGADTPNIGGVPCYPIMGVPQGTVIAGSRAAATLAHGGAIRFDVGAPNAFFTQGLREITAMRSSHFFVRAAGGVAKAVSP